MRAPSPVRPPDGSTDTPGSRAASCSEKFVTGASRGGRIVATVLPSLRFSVSAPVPVTTTTSSPMAACFSEKLASVTSPGVIVTCWVAVAYPTRRLRSSTVPARTLN